MENTFQRNEAMIMDYESPQCSVYEVEMESGILSSSVGLGATHQGFTEKDWTGNNIGK